MRQGFLRSSRYSPGNMDRQSLEALFVGRGDIMEDVLSRVITSIRSQAKHYVLLVGPRGSGKTHFLALAYHLSMDRLEAAKVRDSVVVALLKEEEWGVASFLDLVVRILRALADEAPEISADIDRIYDRFSKGHADAEAFAIARLREHTRDKTLLLLCENLVDLFDGLGDEGQQRWRATIQEDGNWTIVASTPSLFAAVTLQDNPFYGFFTIRALEKIDFETGLELLAKKAAYESKTKLADFIRTPLGRARVRAIHHVAAGNHRAYVVLFDFLNKESLEDLVGPFMDMVDDLTPYYQDRMRQLAPAQRKIVEFLCLEGKPTTIKDISTPCLMSQQTAAKQIGELDAAGFVDRTRVGRNTYCELSEPLMRICIEVKDNKTEHFRLFVEFLRYWFTNRELEQRYAELQREPNAALDLVHLEEAINCSHADTQEPYVEELLGEAKRCFDAQDHPGLAAIRDKLLESGRAKSEAELYELLAVSFSSDDRFDKALSAIDFAINIDNGEEPAYRCHRASFLILLHRFEDAIQESQAVLSMEHERWHSVAQMVIAKAAIGRSRDAEADARELIRVAPTEPDALGVASKFYLSQSRLEQALDLADRMLDINADGQKAHGLRGSILFKMGDYGRASDELLQCVSGEPSSVSMHSRLADSLLLSGEWEQAINVAENLIEVDPAYNHAHYVRGRALVELGRPTDAIAAFDAAEPQPHSSELSVERSSPYVFDPVADSAAKVEAVLGGLLLGRLLAAQAIAAREPLLVALDSLDAALGVENFESDEDRHIEATVGILTVSVRSFGPRQLPQGLAKLRYLLTDRLEGHVGGILTDFLKANVKDGLAGSLADWEQALEGLAASLADLPNCRIPIEMLQVAVRYTKTGDERHLLSLPLEQRQLLANELRPTAG